MVIDFRTKQKITQLAADRIAQALAANELGAWILIGQAADWRIGKEGEWTVEDVQRILGLKAARRGGRYIFGDILQTIEGFNSLLRDAGAEEITVEEVVNGGDLQGER